MAAAFDSLSAEVFRCTFEYLLSRSDCDQIRQAILRQNYDLFQVSAQDNGAKSIAMQALMKAYPAPEVITAMKHVQARVAQRAAMAAPAPMAAGGSQLMTSFPQYVPPQQQQQQQQAQLQPQAQPQLQAQAQAQGSQPQSSWPTFTPASAAAAGSSAAAPAPAPAMQAAAPAAAAAAAAPGGSSSLLTPLPGARPLPAAGAPGLAQAAVPGAAVGGAGATASAIDLTRRTMSASAPLAAGLQQQQLKRPREDGPGAPQQPAAKAVKDEDDVNRPDNTELDSLAGAVDVNAEDAQMRPQQRTISLKDVNPSYKLETVLNKEATMAIVSQLAKSHGVAKVDPECFEYLDLAIQRHMMPLLMALERTARARTDPARDHQHRVLTGVNMRQALAQVAKQDKLSRERHQAQKNEALLDAEKAKARLDQEAKAQLAQVKEQQQKEQQQKGTAKAIDSAFSFKKKAGGGFGRGLSGIKAKAAGAAGDAAKPAAAAGPKAPAAGSAAGQTPAAPRPAAAAAAAAPAAGAGTGAAAAAGGAAGQPAAAKPRMVEATLKDFVSVMERDTLLCRHPLLWVLHGELQKEPGNLGAAPMGTAAATPAAPGLTGQTPGLGAPMGPAAGMLAGLPRPAGPVASGVAAAMMNAAMARMAGAAVPPRPM